MQYDIYIYIYIHTYICVSRPSSRNLTAQWDENTAQTFVPQFSQKGNGRNWETPKL